MPLEVIFTTHPAFEVPFVSVWPGVIRFRFGGWGLVA